MAEGEQKSPVEDLDKARTHYMLASVAGVCLFAGLAEFKDKPSIDVLGLEITSTAFLPALLVVLWLYFCQRFTSLSAAKHRDAITALLAKRVNATEYVRKVFPPADYGLPKGAEIHRRPWLDKATEDQRQPREVMYSRGLFWRMYEFSYQTEEKHVHFIPEGLSGDGGINLARVNGRSLRFWRALVWEWVQLAKALQREPLIGYYYAPRLLGWAAVASFGYWLAHKF